MPLSDETSAGFVLSALANHDSALIHTRNGLCPLLCASLLAQVPQGSEKATALRVLAACARGTKKRSHAAIAPRIRALVAPSLPTVEAQAWLVDAPRSRPGFVPDAGLLHWARRYVRDRER